MPAMPDSHRKKNKEPVPEGVLLLTATLISLTQTAAFAGWNAAAAAASGFIGAAEAFCNAKLIFWTGTKGTASRPSSRNHKELS